MGLVFGGSWMGRRELFGMHHSGLRLCMHWLNNGPHILCARAAHSSLESEALTLRERHTDESIQ